MTAHFLLQHFTTILFHLCVAVSTYIYPTFLYPIGKGLFTCSELAKLGLDCSIIPFKSLLFHQTQCIYIEGAIVGGMIAGWVSQYLGWRFTIVCVFSGCLFLLHGLNSLAVFSIFVCLIRGALSFTRDQSQLIYPSYHLLTAFIPLQILPISFSGLSASTFAYSLAYREHGVLYMFTLSYYSC